MFLNTHQRLSLAIAAAVLALIGRAAAADSDVANVRIIAGGSEETVEVEMNELKVGESRQLTAASGTPAIVTRTDDGLVVEIAGKRTEVHFPAGGSDPLWVDADGIGKQVRVIKIDGGDIDVSGTVEHKVIVMRHGDGSTAHAGELEVVTEDLVGAAGEVDGEKIAALLRDIDIKHADGHAHDHADGDADAERVIVTRKIVRSGDAQD
jgi:hypothetical protein